MAWQLGGEQAGTHDMSLVPMRPLVTPAREFSSAGWPGELGRRWLRSIRRPAKCSGAPRASPDRYVVSDPLLVQDELFALVMPRSEQEHAWCSAPTIHKPGRCSPSGGWCNCEIRGSNGQAGASPGNRRQRSFHRRLRRQRAVLRSGRPAALGCDGRTWCPAAWTAPRPSRPTICRSSAGEMAVRHPAGSAARWNASMPKRADSLAAPAAGFATDTRLARDGRLIVRTGWRYHGASKLASGKLVWQYNERNLFDGYLCGLKGGLLVTRSGSLAREIGTAAPRAGVARNRPPGVKRPHAGSTICVGSGRGSAHWWPMKTRIWSFARSAAGERPETRPR